MGLLDILNPAGARRGGMSPLTLALMGVLAYRTMKGKGRLADMIGMNPTAGTGMGAGMGGGLGGLGGLLAGGGIGKALSDGLEHLLGRFQANGQGDKAQSWIETGANRPIAPGELEQALGTERVQWLMEQTGMSKQELMAGLSKELPEAVDKLTPEGRIPTEQEAERLM